MKKRNKINSLQCNEEGMYLLKYNGDGEEIWATKKDMMLHGQWPCKSSTKSTNITRKKKSKR